MSRHNDILRFHRLLATKPRILVVCGAGLSASSGLPTFRGAGGLWRNHKATQLATPQAFEKDPGLVWLFYAYRRHSTMRAEPNSGHRALAALANAYPNFLCVSQNVDSLLERSGMPLEKLAKIHGCLLKLKCSDDTCTWRSRNATDDPLWPILAPASVIIKPGETHPLLDPENPVPTITREDIPACPRCGPEGRDNIQRPDNVWFNECLDDAVTDGIDAWLDAGDGKVDVVMSIGTSEVVSTGVRFIHEGIGRGAIYVNVNLDAELPHRLKFLREDDFAFGADAAEILPKLFAPIIGELEAGAGQEAEAETGKSEEKTEV